MLVFFYLKLKKDNMDLLTEWEGWRGKYLSRGHGINYTQGQCAMTKSQIFSRPARLNSIIKYFIIPPLLHLILLENF